jgi:hypothetical protein
MLRMAQMIDVMGKGGSPLSLEQMRGRRYPYSVADFQRWKQEIADLANLSTRDALLERFARIEDEMRS